MDMYKSIVGVCLGILGLMSCSSAVNQETEDETATVFFVDSENGNDTNDGQSEDTAWQTLSQIENTELHPGDVVKFKRGSSFEGSLYIRNSGEANRYITLEDYGDKDLPAPSFTNPRFDENKGEYGNCIRLQGDYIIVQNLHFHGTPAELGEETGGFIVMWELGAMYIDKMARHCIVRSNELVDCGVGIKSYGPHALIKGNYIHDCNRVLKAWSWGPIGIWLSGDYQEVSYNKIANYSAIDPRITWGPNSYGGGADGSAIEIDDARIDKSNISIHHNYSKDCQGFLEVTWTDVQQNPDYRNFEIHHNISDDYQQFVAIWRGADFKIDHNTIIRRKVNENDWGVFNITQRGARNLIRNNVIVTERNIPIFNLGNTAKAQPDNIIQNNLYFAAADTLNMGLEGPGDSPIYGNPAFNNYQNAREPADFAITANSMAIDRGVLLDYERDFIGKELKKVSKVDVGAFEY